MPILSYPSPAARTAVIYITLGVLTGVWSGIWYFFMRSHPPDADSTWYWCYGFLLTGLALVVIGLAIGRIGRSARHAELPPDEVTTTVANTEQTAAARAPVIAPVNPAIPAVSVEAGKNPLWPEAKPAAPAPPSAAPKHR